MQRNDAGPRFGRMVGIGIVAGIVAAIAMAMYAMIAAATYQSTGFFTPMYHIASTFIEPATMETSMEHASRGELFYFSPGPAALGMMIHIMTGIAWGVIFVVAAMALNLRGPLAPLVGIVYGLVVFAVMSFAVLPVVADIFGAGEPIAEMPEMVGYATFAIEHALFGLVLGLWLVPRRQDVAAPEARVGDQQTA